MIRVKLEKLLDERKKSVYALCKETGLTPHNLGKLVKGKTTSISFEALEKICLNLRVTPNDVLEIENDEKAEE